MNIHRIGDVTVLNDFAPVPGLGERPRSSYPLTPSSFMLSSRWSSTRVSVTLKRTSCPPSPRWSIPPTCGGCGHILTATTKPRHKPGW